ncbi:MAG: GerAB/ArcD/ProY family transporter [Bacillota bacterium]|nr:GerAB/ArcD/ProY family transporter [Bacillota bacterium]
MFTKTDGKVGTREYVSIVILCISIKFTDTTPTLLFKAGANAGWIIAFTSSLPALISLIFLLMLLKRYNQNLIDIIYRLTGKYIGFILGMLIFLPRFFLTSMNSRNFADSLVDLFYPRTPSWYIYAILIGTSYFLAVRGFEGIGRAAYVMQPYIKLVLLILLIMALKQVNVNYIFPIFGSGLDKIFASAFYYSSTYEEIIQLAIFFPMLRSYKEFKLGSLIGMGYCTFEITLFCFIYITVFDNPPIQIVNYLFQSVTRIVYSGRFVSNLEGMFLFFWAMASFIRFSVHLYMISAYFALTLRLKEFKPFLLPMAALIIIIGMIPDNMFISIFIVRKFLLNTNWVYIYSLPIILFCISQLKGDYNKSA